MKSVVARLVVTSFAVLAVAPAFAGEPKPVQVKEAGSFEGRTLVKADGGVFIELQPHEFNQLSAQQIYEQYRAKFRAAMQADNEKDARKNMEFDQAERAGLYRNQNTQPPTESFYGISIPGGQRVNGMKYDVTREQRLEQPGIRGYRMAKDLESGAVITGSCQNPQGKPDVLGVNFGRSGCFGVVRLFKRFK